MRSLYGNDGYAFYFILLERIYKKNGVLDVQNPAIMSAIKRNITGDSELFDKMLSTAFEIGLFDKSAFDNTNILTSAAIIRRSEAVNNERARKRAYSGNNQVLDVQNTGDKRIIPPKGKVKKKVKDNTPISPFEDFWKVYPRKKSKGDAEKVWNAIKPNSDLLGKILISVERSKQSVDWKKESGKFIPYPATWLRAKGWEDEPQQEGFDNTPNPYREL
jgi:hypothetical protein